MTKGQSLELTAGGGGGGVNLQFVARVEASRRASKFELEGLLYYSSTFKIKCQVTFQLSLSRDYKKAFLETDLALALVD